MAWSADHQWLAVSAVEGSSQIGIWDPKAIQYSSEKDQVHKRI
jgi:hypothetical protein